jgi:hypothetical protein
LFVGEEASVEANLLLRPPIADAPGSPLFLVRRLVALPSEHINDSQP